MGKKTITITFVLLIVALCVSHPSYGQVRLVKTMEQVGEIHVVRIDPSMRIVGESQSINIIGIFSVYHGSASINGDGSVIATNHKVIRWGAEGYEIIDIPYGNQSGYCSPRLDESGRLLAYLTGTYHPSSIIIFETLQERILGRFDMPPPLDWILNLRTSADASTMVFISSDPGGELVFGVDWRDAVFSEPVQLDRVGRVHSGCILASSGDRLFYRAAVPPDSGAVTTKTFVLRRGEAGWSEAEEVELPPPPFERLYAVVRAGRTFLGYAGNKRLALVDQTPSGWSEPEYVDLGFEPLSGKDRITVSEDGSVIAVGTARRPLARYEGGYAVGRGDVYDLFVYLRDESGVWTKSRVNDNQKTLLGIEFLLSGNGHTLYWIPYLERTSDANPEWRLHR